MDKYYFESEEPYYHFYSSDLLGALLFTQALNLSKSNIKCPEKPEWNIPAMNKEGLLKFCAQHWDNPQILSLFAAYTKLRKQEWLEIIDSWQPGIAEDLENYLEELPDADIHDEDDKKKRVRETHLYCKYVYINYLHLRTAFFGGFEVVDG